MKRDFLKNLGIEDKDIIDKIMDENSKDIGKAKGDLESYETKVGELEKAIQERDEKITTLEKTSGDVTLLNEKIKTLEADKAQLTSDLTNKVSEIQKNHAIESGIRDAHGKNVKAIMALLDADKITLTDGVLNGLDEQIKTLSESEDSSFLFGETKGSPKGTVPSTPNVIGGANNTPTSLASAIASALANK